MPRYCLDVLLHIIALQITQYTLLLLFFKIILYRVAFFANSFIPAGTELCYDYGYFEGNVEGKHQACLCKAEKCRKVMY
jgi:hypothetical protein